MEPLLHTLVHAATQIEDPKRLNTVGQQWRNEETEQAYVIAERQNKGADRGHNRYSAVTSRGHPAVRTETNANLRTVNSKTRQRNRDIKEIKVICEKQRSRRRYNLSLNRPYWTLDARDTNLLCALVAAPLVYAATVHWALGIWFLGIVFRIVVKTSLLSNSLQGDIGSSMAWFAISATASLVVCSVSRFLMLFISASSILTAVFIIQNYDYHVFGPRPLTSRCLSRWEVDTLKEDADCRFLEVEKFFLDLEEWHSDLCLRLEAAVQDRDLENLYDTICNYRQRPRTAWSRAKVHNDKVAKCSLESAWYYWVFGPEELLKSIEQLDEAIEDLARDCNVWLSLLKSVDTGTG